MLKHHHANAQAPRRVVILGARGFVGKATVGQLTAKGIDVLALGREDMDLLAEGAGSRLAGLLRADDSLLVISAQVPVKNNAMLENNIRMMSAVCEGISTVAPAHIVYVSSDAVYVDSQEPISETSCAQPASLHGIMHLAREVMLANAYSGPLGVIRPTLIYGDKDPHNGYGPNRFRRLAKDGQDIVLFGEGEERRDHVLIDDVVELIVRMLAHRSEGILNAATGHVVSFRNIAEMVVGHFEQAVAIKGTPRVGPMPHGGYRPFDPTATRAAFPDFTYASLADGLAKAHRDMMGNA